MKTIPVKALIRFLSGVSILWVEEKKVQKGIFAIQA